MDALTDLMGRSRAIEAVRADIRRLIRSGSALRVPAVLIQGETGTGKGLVARLLHRLGSRRDAQFVEVNCAAIPETLLEAEFFGYERGAFTDARRSKPGLFQTAHRGTIFLDEIGLMPEVLQAKLLKVVEERSVRRLGGTHSEPADVWIISATNTNLLAATRTGKFRADLYHRLAVLTLLLPPLRERDDDVLFLAEHFLARACSDYGLPTRTLAADARARVLAYGWPGNVRELGNTMERAALLAETTEVTAAMLDLREAPAPVVDSSSMVRAMPLDDAVQRHMQAVLDETSGNISRAAAILGIARNTLRAHIRKYGLRVHTTAAEAPTVLAAALATAAVPTIEELGEPTTVASRQGTLRWERRTVAALAIALDAAPDMAAFQLASTQQELIRKLATFGARIEELTPVGMIALFGLEPIEDAASRAGHAALALMKMLQRGQDEHARAVQARLAIHSGRRLVAQGLEIPGMDGADRREIRVALDGLIGNSEYNSIVADEAAAEFLRRRFELEPSGAQPPRHFRLLGPGRTGFEIGARGLTPFVGREQNLTPLRDLFTQARGGRGQLVGIMGEPGAGKSRLLHEFRQSLGDEGTTYLEGRCFAYGNTIPYLPIIDIVRGIFVIGPADGSEMIVEKVRAGLQALGIDSKEWSPCLLHLLGSREVGESLTTLSPEAVKARTMEALRQISYLKSRQRPFVIAIEDLQWIDHTSEAALASLAETLATCRVLLLATYRPAYQPPWRGRPYETQVALRRLSPSDSLAIVRAVASEQQLSHELEQAIVSQAEGIPFFLEELARAVAEHPELRSEVMVPATIQDVLTARLDRLPADERDLLQTASILGKDVSVAILRSLSDVPEPEFSRQLERLRDAEFLHDEGGINAPAFTFKHALTHDVAYQSVLEPRRRVLHARVVEVIETLDSERLAENVNRLADHAFRGGVWEKAVPYLQRAGERALISSANREAAEFFQRALQGLRHLPQTPVTLEQAIDIRLKLRDALWALAELPEIHDHLRQAEVLAGVLGDRRRQGWIGCQLCHYSWSIVELDAALDAGERALAISEDLPDPALRAETSFHLGLVHLARGDAGRAAAILSTNLKTLDEVVKTHRGEFASARFAANGPILVRGWMARVLAEVGEFAEAETWGHEAVRLAEAANSPFALTTALAGLGATYVRKGEPTRAIAPLERGLELCQDYNFNNWVPTVAATLGIAYANLGQVDGALALLERAVNEGGRAGIMSSYSLWLTYFGEAALLAGRTSDAQAHGRRALALSREHKEQGYEAWALRLLAEIAASGEPPVPSEAESRYKEALSLAERLGMRPLAARCDLGLARLYGQIGERQAAEKCRARAVALCRALDMPLIQDAEAV